MKFSWPSSYLFPFDIRIRFLYNTIEFHRVENATKRSCPNSSLSSGIEKRNRSQDMKTIGVASICFFLMGLLTTPADVAEADAPALQPSPRPPWYGTVTPTPTPRPTSTPPPPPSHPLPSQPTPAPTPDRLPITGGTYKCGWMLGLGVGFTLLGFALTAFGLVKTRPVPPGKSR